MRHGARTARRARPALLGAALVLVACGADAGSGGSPALETLPDVVLVTVDTLRADHCSAYGYGRPTTPALDALASEGMRVEEAYAVTPTTGPSHATLFSSLYPDEHGVLKNGIRLKERATTLAEVLSGAGYRTAAFVSSYVVRERFGMAQGFEVFDDEFWQDGRSDPSLGGVPGDFDIEELSRDGAETTDRALAWVAAADPSEPVFLWLHLFEPHSPLQPPESCLEAIGADRAEGDDAQRRIALYDAEVRDADDQLGRLLDGLSADRRDAGRVVLFTSDHGEGLGQHGWWDHGVNLHEEALRVPLVLHAPGRVPAGTVQRGPVALIDAMPSLLGLLGLPAGELPMRGRDLSSVWRGGPRAGEEGPVFFQRRAYLSDVVRSRGIEVPVAGPQWAVRSERWKLIVTPEAGKPVLFDLEADAGELHDVSGEHPAVVERLTGAIGDWKTGQQRSHARGNVLDTVREDVEALKALGYVE